MDGTGMVGAGAVPSEDGDEEDEDEIMDDGPGEDKGEGKG
jgi:hypothetical protein